jgi:hypothetical protein
VLGVVCIRERELLPSLFYCLLLRFNLLNVRKSIKNVLKNINERCICSQ